MWDADLRFEFYFSKTFSAYNNLFQGCVTSCPPLGQCGKLKNLECHEIMQTVLMNRQLFYIAYI